MKKRILLQRSLLACALLSTTIFHQWLLPQQPKNFLLWTAGLLLVVQGFLLRMVARKHKSSCSDRNQGLAIDGPYSLTRNPMYLGTLMIGLGTIISSFNLWLCPVFILVFLSIYVPEIRKEQVWLANRFGDQYRTYCRKTPGFFPKLGAEFNTMLVLIGLILFLSAKI